MFIGFWLIVLALGTAGAQRWLDRAANRNASLATTLEDGRREVKLQGDRRGHYSATVFINGEPVRALVDTGATDVSITGAVADRLGLQPGQAFQAITANGLVTVHAVTLDRVALGDLVGQDVSASINRNLPGDEILLGMSFLRKFNLTIRDNVLTLSERATLF